MLELNNHDIKNDSEVSDKSAEINAENNPNFSSNTENFSEAAQTAETELFGQYEIKNWNFSPRLYQIAAASAVLNILALFVFAQSNVLTTRGCESPIVSKVCQVLDTVYVGSSLFGTDTEFVSKEYDPTKLEDADTEIIYIPMDSPPLNYPEGYFALANPEEFEMRRQQQMMMNAENPTDFVMPPTGSIPFPGGSVNQPSISGGNDLNNINPVYPKPNTPFVGELPTSTSGGKNPIAGNPTVKFPRVKNNRPRKDLPNESPAKLPEFDKDATAENKPDEKKEPEPKQPDIKSLPVAEEIINKKPLQDFGEDVLDKVGAKKIDLTKDFKVVMRGTITKEGKFDPKKSGYLKLGNEEGDKELADTAKSAIEAIGDSGILTYLQRLGVENIVFELAQNEKEIYAVITSDQKSESKARTASSGLNGYILIGKATVKEEDTLALLKAAKVESKGKSFILNFNLEKPIAQELINRQLRKAEAKRREQEQKPNGTAEVKPNQNSAK